MSKVIVDEIQTDTTDGNVRIIPNGTGKLEVKGAGGDDAMLQLNCSAQSHGVKIKSPNHSAGQSYTMILPDNNIEAGKFLKVKSIASGSGATAVGQLEYADAGGGVTSDSVFNTVGGTGAGNSIDTSLAYPADANTIFGYNAGYNLTSDDNVLIGFKAGQAMTGSFRNIAIGYEAMLDADGTTYSNIGIGRHACKVVNEGHSNVAVGDSALKALGHADYNVAIGSDALEACTTGSSNVCVGYRSGHSTTSGGENVYMGLESGKDATTAEYNTAVGQGTLKACTTGGSNVAIGSSCMKGGNVTGNQNTCVGSNSGYSITSGSNNVCLGRSAGASGSPSGNITSGSNNVVLGNNSISNLYCADASISSSDSRDKTDVTDFTKGLEWIEALRPVTFRWDRRTWYGTDAEPYGTPDGSKKRQRLHLGFLAQEALAVEQANGYGTNNDDSLILNLTDDGMSYGMKYERLVPILVNAIKELSARVKTLEGG